jgi:hypothetical protein
VLTAMLPDLNAAVRESTSLALCACHQIYSWEDTNLAPLIESLSIGLVWEMGEVRQFKIAHGSLVTSAVLLRGQSFLQSDGIWNGGRRRLKVSFSLCANLVPITTYIWLAIHARMSFYLSHRIAETGERKILPPPKTNIQAFVLPRSCQFSGILFPHGRR